MQINKLFCALGAEITGLDVREVNLKTVQQIYLAFVEHLMLVLRKQDLTPDQQINLNEYFGDVEVYWPGTTLTLTPVEKRYMSRNGSLSG